MKMMSYFKKHFVTRVRNFVFTYRKSIERKCHTTDINIHTIRNFRSVGITIADSNSNRKFRYNIC